MSFSKWWWRSFVNSFGGIEGGGSAGWDGEGAILSSFSSLSKEFSPAVIFFWSTSGDDPSEDTKAGLAGADLRREGPVAEETFGLDTGRGGLNVGALRLEAGFVRFIVSGALMSWLMDATLALDPHSFSMTNQVM